MWVGFVQYSANFGLEGCYIEKDFVYHVTCQNTISNKPSEEEACGICFVISKFT